MNDPPIDRQEQEKLLQWVRATIEAAVRGEPLTEIPDAELSEHLRAPHGVFVTLKERGELRGCIGKMDFERPLWSNAHTAAVASALEDPRFPPVTPPELGEISIEISILNPPEDIPRPEMFDVARHGIIVQKGWRHALLLPKVAPRAGLGRDEDAGDGVLEGGSTRRTHGAIRRPDCRCSRHLISVRRRRAMPEPED